MQILCLLHSITGHKMIFIRLLGSSYSDGLIIDKSGILNKWEENSGPFSLGLNVLDTAM